MNLLNAAKQARDANESLINDDDSDIDYDFDEKLRGIRKATEALRAAIKQAEEAEPVAWMERLAWPTVVFDLNFSGRGIPLYTNPSFAAPQGEQQAVGDSGLTGSFPVGAAPEWIMRDNAEITGADRPSALIDGLAVNVTTETAYDT